MWRIDSLDQKRGFGGTGIGIREFYRFGHCIAAWIEMDGGGAEFAFGTVLSEQIDSLREGLDRLRSGSGHLIIPVRGNPNIGALKGERERE